MRGRNSVGDTIIGYLEITDLLLTDRDQFPNERSKFAQQVRLSFLIEDKIKEDLLENDYFGKKRFAIIFYQGRMIRYL